MDSKDFLVTVVIPYYNKEKTIDRAVSSVLAQSYSNWELIIIDDNSDTALNIHEAWTDFPIVIFRNDMNLGPGPCRQRALEMSSGGLISFLDADDWWHSDFLQSSAAAHLKNEGIAATWCKSMVKTKDGFIERRYNYLNPSKIRETLIQYPRPWATASLMWKKKFCGNWGALSTNQDSWFEVSSSINSNFVFKIDEFYCFVDQTAENRRKDYVDSLKAYFNNFEVYIYLKSISEDHRVSIRLRIIIFNRVYRTLLRIRKNGTSEDFNFHWRKFEMHYPILSNFVKQFFLMKIIVKLLQKSPFKFYS